MANGQASSRELSSFRQPSTAQQAMDVEKEIQHLIQKIFRLRTAVSRLKSSVAKLGGAQDTVTLRQSIATAITRIQDDAQDIKSKLLKTPPEQKTRQTAKLVSDFEVTLKDFQTTLKLAKGREAASLPRQPQPNADQEAQSDAGGVFDDGEGAALLQAQRQQDNATLANEMEYNEALIDERDQGIVEIQQQIGEVNEIFQDLAVLVNDQGGQLNDIEANITRTAERTRDAGSELGKAERSQRAARARMCWIFLIVAVVLGILVLVLAV